MRSRGLKLQIIEAIDSPYTTALMPNFVLNIQQKDTNIYDLIKIISFINPDLLPELRAQLEAIDAEHNEKALRILRRFLIKKIAADESFYLQFGKFYGIDAKSDDEKKALRDAVNKDILRKIKIAYNRIAMAHTTDNVLENPSETLDADKRANLRLDYVTDEAVALRKHTAGAQVEDKKLPKEDEQHPTYDLWERKNTLSKWKPRLNNWSLILTIIVAIGQAAIAASCFVALGVAGPLFWPIFAAAFITNMALMKGDITKLLKQTFMSKKYGHDFLNGMTDSNITGKKRVMSYVSLVFASAAGLTFGFMAFITSQGAIMTILPLIGLGLLAVPGVGWALAAIIALATVPVVTALMFGSMAGFIDKAGEHFWNILNYFNPRAQLNNPSAKDIFKFILSRALQAVLGLAVVAFTLLAIVSTFGSYTSAISSSMQSLFKASATAANVIATVVVFVCTAIPELIFNFKNTLTFVYALPGQAKQAYQRASMVFNSELNLPTKIAICAFLTLTLFFLGCVALNGYGNGRTGSTPDGAGVTTLMKIFSFSPRVAALIGLVTSTGISVTANELYGVETINDTQDKVATKSSVEPELEPEIQQTPAPRTALSSALADRTRSTAASSTTSSNDTASSETPEASDTDLTLSSELLSVSA